jgi:hypothetical protein
MRRTSLGNGTPLPTEARNTVPFGNRRTLITELHTFDMETAPWVMPMGKYKELAAIKKRKAKQDGRD